ncbi:radical SAM/SPASM domain-containing protein [Sporosalibacterium faouarense]|uniref:radical SAM/SPASM domain-containing protein n=1 Tax=Sporosalibacterium faouarense TaxID=516123 RepID=UPI00141D420A|nr:SPASM domain-containing protein [Bacillota bacterium]
MSYKLSRFNLTVPLEESNEVILFNSRECSFVVLDEDTQGFLEDINEVNKYDEEIITNLLEMGFIVDKDLDELLSLQEASRNIRFKNDVFSITIATTLDCNMACYYCFEEKNKHYLDEAIGDKIIEFVKRRISEGNYEKLQVTWTGGEPLLNIKMIEYISKPLIKITEDMDIEYHGTIITNGLLLTEENAKFLKEMKIRETQVTIDGFAESHNKRRISLDNLNSFEIILNNVKVAYKHIIIVIRVNVDDKNKNEIKDLLQYLYNTLDYTNNNRIWVILARVSGCSTSIPMNEYLAFYRNIYDDYMNDVNVEKYYPSPLNFACGAQSKDSYVVDPKGLVYKCWEEIGKEEYAIGTIDNVNDNAERNQKYINEYWPKECNDCFSLPMCHGGCPYKREENNNKPICIPESNTLDIYLRKYYEQWSDEEDSEEEVAGM